MSFRSNSTRARRAFRLGAIALAVGLFSFSYQPIGLAQQAPAAEEQQGPKFDDVIKGLRKVSSTDGTDLMTLYVGKDDGKDSGKLIASVPKSLIGRDLLLAISVSRGSEMGYPAGSILVKWQQVGNSLVLSVPNVRQKQTPGKAVTGAVEATYTPSFLASMPILTRTAAGDAVVDLGSALISNAAAGFMEPGMIPRPDLTTYPKVKVFPENVLVDIDLAMSQRMGPGTTVGVGFSFRALPDLRTNDFKPRVADERVGYFTTIRQDWNTPYDQRETVVRYINRWNVKKLDPALDMSPPDKPIVFVIEKTVPLQFRRYVAEGILEWNKAYEAVGITGAVVVQQQTDDNEFANVDPEDARYNFFRWIVTGRGFAMGPSRPDPRTGEILDADIIFDDSMVRGYQQDFNLLAGPEAMAQQYGPEVISFLERNPAFIPMGMTLNDVQRVAADMRHHAERGAGDMELLISNTADASNEPSPAAAIANALRDRQGPLFHPAACTVATGVRQQIAQLQLIMAKAGDRKVPERLIGQIIKDITAHEVGHTLGLRHNYKGSAWLSPDEIKKRRDAADGSPLFASVMDYNGLTIFPGDRMETVKQVTSPGVGPYDMWAIEYGYRAFEAPAEKDGLAKIASRNNEPGLAYSTDEDVMGLSSPDPLSNRWDQSNDPIAWMQSQSKLADELLADFEKWSVKSDEPQHFLRGAFMSLMFDKTRNLSYVSRLVGGQYHNRNRASDPNAVDPLTPVDPELQRKALDALAQSVFNDDYLKIRPELLNKLVVSRNWDGDSFPSARIDFPVHQYLLNQQSGVLMAINNPVILQRVYDAEMKTQADNKFTAAELLNRTKAIVWGDLKVANDAAFTDAKPMIASPRRNLQKQWINNQLAMANSAPGALMSADLQSMVRQNLRDLSAELDGTIKTGRLDFATKAHLTEVKSRIDRTIDAPEVNVSVDLGSLLFGTTTQRVTPK
jgi:hypothetical protein